MLDEALLYPKHYCCGGTYVKELLMQQVGQEVCSHSHKYDHLSLLATGVVAVTCNGNRVQYSGPTAVIIKAGVEHHIEALAVPVVWYCVHEVPKGLRGEALLDDVVVSGGNSRALQTRNALEKSIEDGEGW